jgi:uncharacterized membrane protein YcaP (DUF421 family)
MVLVTYLDYYKESIKQVMKLINGEPIIVIEKGLLKIV